MAQQPTTRTIRVPRTFVPDEARRIAAEFRAAASQIRNHANNLRQVGSTLDSTWEGNSKNDFMGNFSPEPGAVESYASWLEAKAREIESIQVTTWETKVVR